MKRSLRIKVGSGDFMSIEVDDLLHNIFLTLSDDEFAAIALANGYIKLAPDEVVVKRATAETAYSWVMGFGCDGMTADDRDAQRDLEAVLSREVKP